MNVTKTKRLLFEQPDFLLCLRVGTAILTGLSFYLLADEFRLFYALDGLVSYELLALKQESVLLSIQQIQEYLNDVSPLNFHIWLTVVYYSLSAFLLVGFCTPLSAGLLLLLHAGIFTVIPSYSYGFDYFCQIGLFYCLLFPTYRNQSIDRYLWKLESAKASTTTFCQKILQIHLCIAYFFSGLNKALGSSWWNGEAIWKALHLPYFRLGQNIDWAFLEKCPWIMTLAGLLVLTIEILYPIGFFYRPVRKALVGSIILMHLFIALFMGLYLFSMIMILLNYCAWLAQAEKLPLNMQSRHRTNTNHLSINRFYGKENGREPRLPRRKTLKRKE